MCRYVSLPYECKSKPWGKIIEKKFNLKGAVGAMTVVKINAEWLRSVGEWLEHELTPGAHMYKNQTKWL